MARDVSQQKEQKPNLRVPIDAVDWVQVLLPVMQQIDEMRPKENGSAS